MTTSPFFFIIKKVNVLSKFSNDYSSVSTKSRSGVSPVIATTIILAVTITMGLALWSFANSGVSTATSTYASVITDYGGFVSDKFVITNVAFNYPSNDHITFWIYNSGKLATSIKSVVLVCKDCTGGEYTPAAGDLIGPNLSDPTDMTLASKQLGKYSFDGNINGSTSIPSGKTFEITVTSDTGASQTFLKKSG